MPYCDESALCHVAKMPYVAQVPYAMLHKCPNVAKVPFNLSLSHSKVFLLTYYVTDVIVITFIMALVIRSTREQLA